MEDDVEMNDEQKKKKAAILDASENIFADLDFEGKYSGKTPDDKLLGKKKNKEKKKKNIQIELFGKKKRVAKPEPSKLQQILNTVVKSNEVTKENVMQTAVKLNYQMEENTIKLLVDLGKAKVAIKKVGVPQNICKKKLHFYGFLKPLFDKTSVVTDDRIVWEVFIGGQVFIKEDKTILFVKYKDIMQNYKIKTFSMVSLALFNTSKFISGYCQDELKDVALINEGGVTELKIKDFKEKLQTNNVDIVQKAKIADGQLYDLYQYENMIISIPSGSSVDKYLEESRKVHCVNSKTNLTDGLRNTKINNEVGSYLNLHEIPVTDFSPACLFISPIKNYAMFLNIELDNNIMYEFITKKINEAMTIYNLDLPQDCVFWDNIGSFVEMLGLISVTQDIAANKKKEIAGIIETYHNDKYSFSAWKNIYNSFESIIMHFYDSVTNKLTIDGVTKLQEKVDNFLSNYLILKNHESYTNILSVLSKLKFCNMMTNFANTRAPADVVTAIKKVNYSLMSGNTAMLEKEKLDIESAFRTTAIMCLEVMYGGYWSMIPKIRSRVSFLGGVDGDLVNDQNLRVNIKNLMQMFEDKKKEKKEDKMNNFLSMKKEVEDIMDKTLDNTLQSYKNNPTISKYAFEIKKAMMNDPSIYESMVDDITAFMNDPDYDEGEAIAYANFLENPDVMGFMGKFNDIIRIFTGKVEEFNLEKALKAINTTKKNEKKRLVFKYSIGRNKKKNKKAAPIPDLRLPGNAVQIDTETLLTAVAKPGKNFINNVDGLANDIRNEVAVANQ